MKKISVSGSLTILRRGWSKELKTGLLPLRRVSLLFALPPLEATREEEKRNGAEGGGSDQFLGACADAHLEEIQSEEWQQVNVS